MSMIDNDWLPAIKGEYSKPYYRELFTFVKDEYSKYVVYPPADDIFNAFHFTPLSKVKVLILGQDPYHNHGQAHGLCFSVQKGVEIPPSLVNIYKELHDDLGCTILIIMYIRHMDCLFQYFRERKHRLHLRIYIKNCMMTVDVIFLITDILRNGPTRECFCLTQCLL